MVNQGGQEWSTCWGWKSCCRARNWYISNPRTITESQAAESSRLNIKPTNTWRGHQQVIVTWAHLALSLTKGRLVTVSSVRHHTKFEEQATTVVKHMNTSLGLDTWTSDEVQQDSLLSQQLVTPTMWHVIYWFSCTIYQPLWEHRPVAKVWYVVSKAKTMLESLYMHWHNNRVLKIFRSRLGYY